MQIGMLIIAAVFWSAIASVFFFVYENSKFKEKRESWDKLINKAKQNAPAIIFIDEIDAIGKSRGALRNDEREATLNQLLTEMDGFEKSEGVIVIAATNKVDLLDDALLRAGRFDRRVYVELPGLEDREEILKIYLKNLNLKIFTSQSQPMVFPHIDI